MQKMVKRQHGIIRRHLLDEEDMLPKRLEIKSGGLHPPLNEHSLGERGRLSVTSLLSTLNPF